jgi:hypothetical protein
MNLLSLVLVVLLVLLGSCTKEVVGPQGPSGVSGKDGVSNLHVEYVTIKSSDWVYDDLYKQFYYQHKLSKRYSDSSLVTSSLLTNSGFQLMPISDSFLGYTINFLENVSNANPYIEFQYTNTKISSDRPVNDYKFKLSILESVK